MSSRFETALWFGLLFAVCGLVVWVRTATVKATYRYVQNQKEMALLEQQIQETRLRWLKLTSPSRLEMLAEQLQLAPADTKQRVRYASGSKLH